MLGSERTVRLAERRRFTITNLDTHSEEASVHCPVSRGASAVTHCLGCPRFERKVAIDGRHYIECRVPVEKAEKGGFCGELLSAELTCLDGELEVSKAVATMAAIGVLSAPVIDDNGVLVGMVSTAALARLQSEQSEFHGFGRDLTPSEVEDAMSTDLVTLSQHASVDKAARLMVARGLERVAVVTDDGHLVGVLSAGDLVRWVWGG